MIGIFALFCTRHPLMPQYSVHVLLGPAEISRSCGASNPVLCGPVTEVRQATCLNHLRGVFSGLPVGGSRCYFHIGRWDLSFLLSEIFRSWAQFYEAGKCRKCIEMPAYSIAAPEVGYDALPCIALRYIELDCMIL